MIEATSKSLYEQQTIASPPSSNTPLDVKTIQIYLLNMAIFVHNTCIKNNINYYIDGGTLLGAIRSNSFIPWDDDLDICLLKSDHVKLLKVLEKACENHPYYNLYYKNKEIYSWSDYLYDARLRKDYIYPLKIDLIASKIIPNNPAAIQLDKSLVALSDYFIRGIIKHPAAILKEHQRYLNPSLSKRKHLKKEFIDLYEKYLQNHSKIIPNGILNYAFNDVMVKKTRPYLEISDVFPIKEITFEGLIFNCPNNIKNYLTFLYGVNHMTPPPINEQRPVSGKVVFSKMPKAKFDDNLKLFLKYKEHFFSIKKVSNPIIRIGAKLVIYSAFLTESIIRGKFSFLINSIRHNLYLMKK